MNEVEFNDEVDALFAELEDRVDELELDVDIDASGGLLTVSFNNGASIIFSRQSASREIWVAAKSGGYHLTKSDSSWQVTSSGEKLPDLVNRVFSEQLGEDIQLLS